MVDVRQRRHEETRSALVDAALDIAEAEGYTGLTMERVAERAGVSRRTVYRRFRSKDDIVLELPRRWLQTWDDAVAAAPAGLRAREIAELGSLAVSASIDDRPRDVLVGLQILAEAPSIATAGVATESWHRRVLELLAADPTAAGWSEAECAYVAGAYLGAIDSMLAVRAADDGRSSLVEANRLLLDRLRPSWPS